jgi:hypothetical protein
MFCSAPRPQYLSRSHSDSKAVALAVELEAAARFILSYPKWLAYRWMQLFAGEGFTGIYAELSSQSSWYHSSSRATALVRPSLSRLQFIF